MGLRASASVEGQVTLSMGEKTESWPTSTSPFDKIMEVSFNGMVMLKTSVGKIGMGAPEGYVMSIEITRVSIMRVGSVSYISSGKGLFVFITGRDTLSAEVVMREVAVPVSPEAKSLLLVLSSRRVAVFLLTEDVEALFDFFCCKAIAFRNPPDPGGGG